MYLNKVLLYRLDVSCIFEGSYGAVSESKIFWCLNFLCRLNCLLILLSCQFVMSSCPLGLSSCQFVMSFVLLFCHLVYFFCYFSFHFISAYVICNNLFYYMAMSQKDWKQTNSRIWLAKIDLDRGLDFPI